MFPYLEEKKIYLRDMHIGFELIHTKKSASFPYLLEKPRALDRLIYDYEKFKFILKNVYILNYDNTK